MKRSWMNMCVLVVAGTLIEGCQNTGTSTNRTARKPLGQRLFGTLGEPATKPPYVPSSTLPGGVPPGSVMQPPPGAIILDANGQPLPPGGAPPAGTVVPPGTFGTPPSGASAIPPLGYPPSGTPYGAPITTPYGAPNGVSGAVAPGGSTPLAAPSAPPVSGGALPPLPPSVATSPSPSPTGPIQSQSKRFSNEELQNSVRLGAPGNLPNETTPRTSAEPPIAKSEAPSVAPVAVAPSATTTPSPLDIPRYVKVKNTLAFGRQPFPDGIVWLKQAGFKKVVHVAGTAEIDDAAQKLFEREGIQYIRIEMNPDRLDAPLVNQFSGAIASNENTPVFVYDRDGSRLGALWMAHRVLDEKASVSQARAEAESIGFNYEKTATLDPIRKALDKLLPAS